EADTDALEAARRALLAALNVFRAARSRANRALAALTAAVGVAAPFRSRLIEVLKMLQRNGRGSVETPGLLRVRDNDSPRRLASWLHEVRASVEDNEAAIAKHLGHQPLAQLDAISSRLDDAYTRRGDARKAMLQLTQRVHRAAAEANARIDDLRSV